MRIERHLPIARVRELVEVYGRSYDARRARIPVAKLASEAEIEILLAYGREARSWSDLKISEIRWLLADYLKFLERDDVHLWD